MGRRERLQARLERRQEWAEKARRESARRFEAAHLLADQIPLGQPILVGHHSEGRARRDAERIHGNMSKGCEAADRAEHHSSKTVGLERALDRSIFSDDADAVSALERRIEERERLITRMKLVNAAWRKAKCATTEATREWLTSSVLDPPWLPGEREAIAGTFGLGWRTNPAPFEPFELSNLRGRITADRERIKSVKARAAKTAEADAAGGVVVTRHGEAHVSVLSGRTTRERVRKETS